MFDIRTDLADRKAEHLRIAAGPGVGHAAPTGLDAVRLRHRALPGRDLDAVSLECDLLGRRLAAPLLVSAMTGGTPAAAQINHRLARAAAEHGIAFALGSGRRLLDDPDDPEALATYVRPGAERPPLLLANLGAAQIRERGGVERAGEVVARLEADALAIHLNPLQEAVQPEGEPVFSGVVEGIARVVDALSPVPVVVKEVGFGLDPEDVALLRDAGVAAVDVAGAGGTNWALIEGERDPGSQAVAGAFADWGLPTADAVRAARDAAPALSVIASGGVADGVDAAKCLALGADAVGFARPLLVAAQADRVPEALATLTAQLRIATWLAGAASARELGREHLR